jgi:ammonia channel protein AmtB
VPLQPGPGGPPKIDPAWMIAATALVLMMTIPGLALFYSGMVRKKNVLATMAQSLAATWVILKAISAAVPLRVRTEDEAASMARSCNKIAVSLAKFEAGPFSPAFFISGMGIPSPPPGGAA